MEKLVVIIKGVKPIPKQRPQFNSKKKTAYTPKRTLDYERIISSYVKSTMNSKGMTIIDRDIPLKITCKFCFQITKSWPKKKKEQALNGEIFPITSNIGDVDNLVKAIEDAMNGIAYVDDGQIVKVESEKVYAEENQIIIILEEYKK